MKSSAPQTIEPGRSMHSFDLSLWWKRKHVLMFLVQRDLTVRYKQTYIGCFWVILQPLIELIILVAIFQRFVGDTRSTLPYTVFILLGLLPWTYVITTIQRGTASLVDGSDLMLRMSFPRLFLPVAKALSQLVDFLVSSALLIPILLYYDMSMHWGWLWVIPLSGLCVLFSISVAILFSALHALYRDIGLIIPYIIRLTFFITPVVYPLTVFRERWNALLHINPLAGIIETARVVAEGQPITLEPLLPGITVTLLFFVLSLLVFRILEPRVLDVV